MTTEPLDVDGVARAGGGERWSGMPRDTVMGHIHLHVATLDEAEAFFHAAIGLEKTVWSYPGALFLAAGGYHHHVGTNTWAAGSPPSGAHDARLLEWELVLPASEDVERTAARCTAAGYDVAPAGGTWLVTDPSGTRLRVRA
jgi:catechol 2,3-dioxygenase